MYDLERIYRAKDVADAIAALERDPRAVVICGGSDVLIRIREGKLAGRPLVSIHGLPELSEIRLEPDGTLVIGPAVPFAQVTGHPLIQRLVPALGEAVDQAGGPQLRNVGTIGGNVCNGATSADSAPTLLTLNAVVELTGPQGVRRAPLAEFYLGPGRVDLRSAELCTAIRIARADYEGFFGLYIKYAQRNAMDIATLGCAVHVKLNPEKTAVEALRLAFGVAAPTPIRCHGAEAQAADHRLDGVLLDLVGNAAAAEVNPRTSWRASREFRLQLVRELSRRALAEAARRAGGVLDA